MADWIYLLFIPAMLVIVWFWPERKSAKPAEKNVSAPSHHKQSSRYHAVSIQPGAHACSAVLAMQGKRFLATEAVNLPLMTCDATKCTCTYKHHTDRRYGYDRRHDRVVMENVYSRGEHRSGFERRRQHAY